MPFQKILVAIDGSSGGQKALEIAIELAKLSRAELHALAVEGAPRERLPRRVAQDGDGDDLRRAEPAAVQRQAHGVDARGRVALSSAFRLSGLTSVELQDAPGDGDFPELQGTFPRVSSGTLYAHFGFLTRLVLGGLFLRDLLELGSQCIDV